MSNKLEIKYYNNSGNMFKTLSLYCCGKYEINKKTYICDNSGFVYKSVEGEKQKHQDPLNYEYNNDKKCYNYSDGTLCDDEGYVYDLDVDNERYRLFEPIQTTENEYQITCEKQLITIKVCVDDVENSPNFFISNISDEIEVKKKWDGVDIYLSRNYSQNKRTLTFTVNHLTNSELKSIISIVQDGDVCNIAHIDKTDVKNIGIIKYNNWDSNVNILHTKFYCLQKVPKNDEKYCIEEINFEIKVSGGSKNCLIKHIEQFKTVKDENNQTSLNGDKTNFYVEEVIYDNALQCSINNNILTIKNYGCLSLDEGNVYYIIHICHSDNYEAVTKIGLCHGEIEEEIQPITTYSLKRRAPIINETIYFTNESYTQKIFIPRQGMQNISIQNECEWLNNKVVNNFIHIKCNENVYNVERNTLVNVLIGDTHYKTYQITQAPYIDYKIKTKYPSYTLEYNEEFFEIKVDVYGGDKKIEIVSTDNIYEYNIKLIKKHTFFNTYYIKVTPKINLTHNYITETLIIKHINDEIYETIEFTQLFNIKTLPYTIDCENHIILEKDSNNYILNVNTYPFDDSAITCTNTFKWLSCSVHNHQITLKYSQNNFTERECFLTIINNEFPHKKKIVKITQKGAK